MPTKLIKLNLLVFLLLPILVVFLLLPHNLQAASSDAIAIRIVPNPNHYSVLHWYGNQGFTGSPQAITIDGYAAIRDGRTAYVNVANIKDDINLSTDILIISYNQDSETMTVDIFGQLVKNLKFNTNISGPGTCSVSSSLNCVYSSDCPSGEYCSSQKSKIIRDVKRLEDLAEIKSRLDVYKLKNNFYPVLASGTYVAGTSLSTWPSWQQTLAVDLGFTLPVDPLNKLGTCPNNYDATTCWDAKTFLFATDLTKYILPVGSHVYLYQSHNSGASIKYCTQTESNYPNLNDINCFISNKGNQAPIIKAASLIGTPNMEFNGYVSISDPDNNPLTLSVGLVSLSDGATWTSKNWQFSPGLVTFSVLPTSDANQKKIYALKTGSYNKTSGYYSVKLTVNDGQGAPNSIASGTYPITLSQVSAYLNDAEATVAIGTTSTLSMTGSDINGDPFTTVSFKDANLDNTNLPYPILSNHGFTLSGMNLLETFKPSQHTGTYTVNVCGHNPNQMQLCIPASFTYKITNSPPVFTKLTANFKGGSSQTCTNPSGNCTVAIDNGENANIVVAGLDPDGHIVIYSLVDNFGGKLTIDSGTGKISGLEKLNREVSTDATSTITVKMSDQYCANSKPEECSNTTSFNLTVKAYCSVTKPESLKLATFFPSSAAAAVISTSPGTLTIGTLDCSAIGSSTANVTFVGSKKAFAHNQNIVLVSDVSGSMNTSVPIGSDNSSAITRLINALVQPDGLLDRIYNASVDQSISTFKVGSFAYSNFPSYISIKTLTNIMSAGALAGLKNSISDYSASGVTNTLNALNKAEEMLAGTGADTEKIVILMSDGLPLVAKATYTAAGCYCDCPLETWANPNPYPNCTIYNPLLTCPPNKILDKCNNCSDPTCPCGGTWPNCYGCYYGGGGTYVPFLNTNRFIANLFNINEAQANTIQTKCINSSYPDNQGCVAGSSGYMSGYTDYYCDIKSDVDTQAQVMKNNGIKIYSIYYDTQHTDAPAKNMCNWSSNGGQNCGSGYAFAGTDINEMIKSVTNNILILKPRDATIGTVSIFDPDLGNPNSATSTDINGLTCGNGNKNMSQVVTYNGEGSLEFSDIKINYCPAKLHS